MAKAKKSKRKAKAVKKTKARRAPVKAAKTKKTKAKKAKKAPAKKASVRKTKARKTKTKKPARKAAAKAPARKTSARKAAPKRKKQIVGEGDYAASRAFLNDQAAFVKRNESRIPRMGKEAEAALDGPEGDELRAAEEEARARGQ